jgi:hypothetical protein
LEEKMEYIRQVRNGNYAVVITYLFGAIGIAYGASQIIGSNPSEASSTGGIVFLALAAGGVWGMIGLIFGATISAIISAGIWSIPMILGLVFLAFQFNVINH